MKPNGRNSESAHGCGGQVDLHVMRRLLIELYNTGYHAGHEDTVEGCYTDVLPADMDSYHDDVVDEWVREYLGNEFSARNTGSEARRAFCGRVDSVVGPRRIQRKRIRGWKMPENTVSVCRPGKFGNPFLVTEGVTQAEAVTAFRIWLMGDSCMAGMPERKQQILDGLPELRGKNLACFCEEGTPCHADVLLDLANS